MVPEQRVVPGGRWRSRSRPSTRLAASDRGRRRRQGAARTGSASGDSPLSVYGQSNADGDRAAAVVERQNLVRTTWVVGDGGNFVRTMAALADRGVQRSVVAYQIGRLTFTADIAGGIEHLLATGAPFGSCNLTCAGEPASWAEVAAAVYEARGRSADDVTKVSTAEYFAGKPAAAHDR